MYLAFGLFVKKILTKPWWSKLCSHWPWIQVLGSFLVMSSPQPPLLWLLAVCVMGTVLLEKEAVPQPDTLPAAAWRVQILGSSQQQGGALSNSPTSSEGKAVAMSCLMSLYIT